MRVTIHERSPKPEAMTLTTDPLTIWLNRTAELRIERGDRLDMVAIEVRKHWPLTRAVSLRLVAFWFALGERVAHGSREGEPWHSSELRAETQRRYLAGVDVLGRRRKVGISTR